MVLSNRSGPICTRELKEEALGNDCQWSIETNGEGGGLQFLGWAIRRERQRLENKRYEVIGVATLAHKIEVETSKIVRLKSTREGTEENTCCWKN